MHFSGEQGGRSILGRHERVNFARVVQRGTTTVVQNVGPSLPERSTRIMPGAECAAPRAPSRGARLRRWLARLHSSRRQSRRSSTSSGLLRAGWRSCNRKEGSRYCATNEESLRLERNFVCAVAGACWRHGMCLCRPRVTQQLVYETGVVGSGADRVRSVPTKLSRRKCEA